MKILNRGNTWCDSSNNPKRRIDYTFSAEELCDPIEKSFLENLHMFQLPNNLILF